MIGAVLSAIGTRAVANPEGKMFAPAPARTGAAERSGDLQIVASVPAVAGNLA